MNSLFFTVPDFLEPLAEQARKFSLEELRSLIKGVALPAEEEAEQNYADQDQLLNELWSTLLTDAIKQGMSRDVAAKFVRGDRRFQNQEDIAEDAYFYWREVQAVWNKAREEVKQALTECVRRNKIKVFEDFSIEDLFLAARKTGLDKASKLVYNESMDQIDIARFNVVIPENTAAFKIERACEDSTAELNSTPLKVDLATWKKNWEAILEQVEATQKACEDHVGRRFKPNSPKEVSELLFQELKLPVQRTTGRGQPSTDEDTLQALASMGHEIARLIMEAKKAISKMSQLREWEIYARAGSVQATWNQYGTPMGRYSCEEPNLQSRIHEIRETIVAEEGWSFVSCDLGQAEYVVWASLSEDPVLGQSFLNGNDFHIQMYNEIMQAAPSAELTGRDPRQSGKTINFALLYLMQAFVLAKALGVSSKEAQAIIDAYEARAPKAIEYRKKLLEFARLNGQTYTKYGRTRFMPEFKSAQGAALHQANKTAWHHHNSGTAAELLKIKQVKVWNSIKKEGFKDDVRFALQMHDELIVMVRDEVRDAVSELMKSKFEEPTKGFLPIRVDQRIGPNWLSISK